MLSVLFELAIGVLLFLAALALIPKLLSGERQVYEIAIPFTVSLILLLILTNNLYLSLLISAVITAVIYYIRKRRI